VKADASYDLGCLPSAETLRRIRWPLRPRSRDRHTTFRAMGRPLDDALAPPWVFVRSSPVHSGMSPEPRRSFRPPYPPMVSPTAVHFELGPRSLDPVRSFWSAFAELIWDQTSPTDFCNCTSTCGQPNLDSLILVGTTASTVFLFSTCHALRLATTVTCDESRFVRSCRPQCWFLPVPRVCPTVMPTRTPHHSTCAECVVRIDEHEPKDRAKDASS
jgi:hypothetical protein